MNKSDFEALSRKELVTRLSGILGGLKQDRSRPASGLRALIAEIEGAGVLDVQKPAKLPKWLVYVPGKGHWAIKYDGNDKRIATRTYLRWVGLERLPVDAFVSRVDEGKKWLIYIPDEGHWPIKYDGDDPKEARAVYLKWAKRKALPPGASIGCDNGNGKFEPRLMNRK